MNDQAHGRLARLQRERPGLYAGRHVVKGIGKVLLTVIGIAVSLRLLALVLPDIPFPDIALPDFPFPGLPFPDLSLPDWLRAVLRSAKYWVPILIGVLAAFGELERRRNRTTETGAR